jgi:hypothetical protein
MRPSSSEILHSPVTHVFHPQPLKAQPSVNANALIEAAPLQAAPLQAAASTDINGLVNRVIERLPQGVPYVMPKHIGPILGITANGLTVHCRKCRALRAWRGEYRFFMDDPDHVTALRELIRLALWSGVKLPADLRPAAGYGCAGYGCAGYGCAGYGCAGYGCAGYGCAGYGCASGNTNYQPSKNANAFNANALKVVH